MEMMTDILTNLTHLPEENECIIEVSLEGYPLYYFVNKKNLTREDWFKEYEGKLNNVIRYITVMKCNEHPFKVALSKMYDEKQLIDKDKQYTLIRYFLYNKDQNRIPKYLLTEIKNYCTTHLSELIN